MYDRRGGYRLHDPVTNQDKSPGPVNRCHQSEGIIMFGLNRAEGIGRLGAVLNRESFRLGARVADLSVATDESYARVC